MLRSYRLAAAFAAVCLCSLSFAAGASPPASLVASGCEEQELSLQYPAEPFKKLLPVGFKLNTLDPTGLIAAVDISIDHCESVGGGSGSNDFLAFVEVVPPAAYQQADIAAYGLLIQLWSTRPQTVETFTAWGFGSQAAAGAIEFGTGLDLLGRKVGSIRVKAGGSTLTATTLITTRKTVFPAGTTRGFATDAAGALHILDASWTDQTTQFGAGTFVQSGTDPLPLPLIVQAYPVIAAHASDYSLTLQPVQ
jgi:hypothetical protein